MVMFTNLGGAPIASYVRLDDYPERGQDETAHWFNVDELRTGDGSHRWGALCQHWTRRSAVGPYLLNVGELLGGTE